MTKIIYLDNNATTLPSADMLSEIALLSSSHYANPSSPYSMGEGARDVINNARENVAKVFKCSPHEVIFTSGGTESNWIALNNDPELGHLNICPATEHPSVLNCCIEKVGVTRDGFVDLDQVEMALKKHTTKFSGIIVSAMLANNETGVISDPCGELPALCEKYSAGYHIDGVQGFGKGGVSLSAAELGASTISISGHKAHGLKGAGALYVREGTSLIPAFCGGSHEFGLRPGTENQLGIFSMGYVANNIMSDEYQKKISMVKAKRDRLESTLASLAEVNGSKEFRVENTTNLYFHSIPDVDLLMDGLYEEGVCVSGKSACSSGMPTPSRVIQAMYGKEGDRASKSIRMSLSVDTTDEDIDKAIDAIQCVVADIS